MRQSLESLCQNAADWSKHTLTLVMDGKNEGCIDYLKPLTYIDCSEPMGASRARNIGAASIPKYRRQKRVMFLDDDVLMCPGWDTRIEGVMEALGHGAVVSGHSHPYNHPLGQYDQGGVRYHAAGVLSTVNMAMYWEVWDDVGWWKEPGGVGGSEDVDWCARAVAKGYGLAVVEPQVILHCGTRSSNGKDIVGRDLVIARNEELVKHYGLEGVKYV